MSITNDTAVTGLLYRTFRCDARGRLGSAQEDISYLDSFIDIAEAYISVKFADVFPDGETNPNKIKDGLYRARINAINNLNYC